MPSMYLPPMRLRDVGAICSVCPTRPERGGLSHPLSELIFRSFIRLLYYGRLGLSLFRGPVAHIPGIVPDFRRFGKTEPASTRLRQRRGWVAMPPHPFNTTIRAQRFNFTYGVLRRMGVGSYRGESSFRYLKYIAPSL